MKKIICLVLACTITFCGLFAQQSKIPIIDEIAQIENEDEDVIIEVFSMIKDGQKQYYLNVGNLGFGDEIIQVHVDPLYKLFIPLGETLTGAVEILGQMQGQLKANPGTVTEYTGIFAPLTPTDKTEPVKVTTRKILLARKLEFSLQRDGYLRATYVSKSDLSSLLTNLKIYRKMHPKEK